MWSGTALRMIYNKRIFAGLILIVILGIVLSSTVFSTNYQPNNKGQYVEIPVAVYGQLKILRNDNNTQQITTVVVRNDTLTTVSANTTTTSPPDINRTMAIRVRAGLGVAGKIRPLICGGYKCTMQSGGRPGIVDLTMFNVDSVEHYQTPPKRRPGELWVFQTTEPQWFSVDSPELWDGLFNYSLTYISSTEGAKYNFADILTMKPKTDNRNFAKIRKKRKSDALWFVSHCAQPNRKLQVTSGRAMYVGELAKYIQIDVYTRKPSCREQMGSLVKKEDPEHPPRLKDYIFYLAFENSLCKDYITEKLWKVLEAPTYTIPVVLGGLSIEEYTKVAPPNSFIHVKNFTSPKALADHLKYVAENDDAFNYYFQWRNRYTLTGRGTFSGINCYYCQLAHQRPQRTWDTFSEDFGSHNCLNVSAPSNYHSYYNFTDSKYIV